MLGTSARIGSPADTLAWNAQEAPNASLWISLVSKDGTTYVTTSNKQIYSWPSENPTKKQLLPLIRFLEKRLDGSALSTVTSRRTSLDTATLLIAADQHLSYGAFKPLLYVMSRAKITNYGFETRRIRVSQRSQRDQKRKS
jgi:hypothetical protein